MQAGKHNIRQKQILESLIQDSQSFNVISVRENPQLNWGTLHIHIPQKNQQPFQFMVKKKSNFWQKNNFHNRANRNQSSYTDQIKPNLRIRKHVSLHLNITDLKINDACSRSERKQAKNGQQSRKGNNFECLVQKIQLNSVQLSKRPMTSEGLHQPSEKQPVCYSRYLKQQKIKYRMSERLNWLHKK